jgi:hypothetical protein
MKVYHVGTKKGATLRNSLILMAPPLGQELILKVPNYTSLQNTHFIGTPHRTPNFQKNYRNIMKIINYIERF